MISEKYKDLYELLIEKINKKRIFHDPMHTLAYGTDASFYRLIPKLVILAENEDEISLILKFCSELRLPVTFRAAGTSLSGQAISDSVLVIAGNNWNRFSINNDGSEIKLQPGLTGGRANSLLSGYGRKIGPDPASINAAMIGGIAANNASGMCCGTSENSYKTVSGIRVIFADGTLLDTKDKSSRDEFQKLHPELLSSLSDLAESVKNNSDLAGRIRKKYKMKNTTGYSINSLTDFSDPFDIIEHLMIGSEGTLGFISEISFRTVIEHPYKASALIIFPDTAKACMAVNILKSLPVTAVELIDRPGLRSVEKEKGLSEYLNYLNDQSCALLVETVSHDKSGLSANIERITGSIIAIHSGLVFRFTDDPEEYELLWKIRKGLFPSIGAMRKSGTTVIIEDVAFPTESLADATGDLQDILKKHGYSEAVIFGHALEGNLHFVFTQEFNSQKEIDRYRNLMQEVSELVVNKYDGSLKAEHGTGRNMAPFVEMEWGTEAYQIMQKIKNIFDPSGILNPGVILNTDSEIHLKNLKPIPVANEIIDKCTECGFCEPVCVSAGMTLSPRQRIVVHREIISLSRNGHEPHIAASLAKSFSYSGNETCATDGLCAGTCPVNIDTGKLVKYLRAENIRHGSNNAMWLAERMALLTSAGRKVLLIVDFFHLILGTTLMQGLTSGLRALALKKIPAWNKYMPSGARPIRPGVKPEGSDSRKVVYFPSCINRTMGVSADHRKEKQLSETLVNLLIKGGYEVIYPEKLNNLCCGMAFASKGYTEAGGIKSRELEASLLAASLNGKYPVLCDMSPCLYTMRENMSPELKLYEPVEFIYDHLIQYLDIKPVNETVTVFPVCSTKKMGLEKKLVALAELCANEVIITETNCCGFAGDRGFTYPELNRHGLRDIRAQLPINVRNGYSNSRTCEIGLSLHSGISYKSIVYLVDKAGGRRQATGDGRQVMRSMK